MIPFLFFDLKERVTILFEIIIKQTQKIELSSNDNLSNGKVGFAVTEELN